MFTQQVNLLNSAPYRCWLTSCYLMFLLLTRKKRLNNYLVSLWNFEKWNGIQRTRKQNNPERNSVTCTQANSMNFSKAINAKLNSEELDSQA